MHALGFARTVLGPLSLGLAIGCGSDDGSSGAKGSDGGSSGAGGTSGAGGGGGSGDAGNVLAGSCPTGFSASEGKNSGFSSDGIDREFHVLLPSDTRAPRPIFVSLTGTVQEELSFAAQSELDKLTERGFIVVAPVRTCSQEATNCAQGGTDGRIWEPWYDGTFNPSDDEGRDVRFVDAAVRCIAESWPVAEDRVYIGGISAGGSFTNRNLTFNSELFAGGVVASGNWYNGGAAPGSPVTMESSIAIIIWGGPDDVWPPGMPIADYDPETRLAAQFYNAQPNLVAVSCSGTHGHIWPTALTPWLVDTLQSHPKGTDPRSFVLTEPPAGFSCVLGEYTDH